MNVFDIVEEFYTQDPEWNTVLERRHVDNYLRTLAWQGVSDEKLTDIWSNIMLLCVFLGNSENFLGDMNRENFIDCVGWCGRNVAGFSVNVSQVQDFLGDISDFYKYLKKKKVIFHDDAPAAALEKLVVNDKIQLMDRKGNFLSEVEKYNLYSSPDLPTKVFINVMEKMDNLLEAIRNYYNDNRYHRDIERAAFLYSGIMVSGVIEEKPDSEEYAQSFWDYFLFDYHLLGNDKRPIQQFYDDMCANNYTIEGEAYEDILLELMKTRLVAFTVEGSNADNTYNCRDILTKEIYALVLPIDENADLDDMVFMGHIYYNDTMVVNFIRGFKIGNAALKRMVEVMQKAKKWFAIRYNGKMSWEAFTERNAMFLRHCCVIFSSFLRLDCFNYETHLAEYFKQEIIDDNVNRMIQDMMKPYHFSAYDISLCQQMWSDYVMQSDQAKVRTPNIWAAGVIRNFIDLNGVYNYDAHMVSEICRNVPVSSIYRTSKKIEEALELENSDPRYINEEGLLLMLLS